MRRFFSYCLLLCSVVCYGQDVRRASIFDFTNPETLTPSIQMNQTVVDVNDSIFVNNEISVSFQNKRDLGLKIRKYNGSCYLHVYRGSIINISGNEVKIDSIIFDKNSVFTGLGLVEGQEGRFLLGDYYSDSKNVSSVVMEHNSDTSAEIKKFTVYYTVPADKLEFSSIYPSADKSLLTSEFENVTVTFNKNVNITDTAQFVFVKSDTEESINATGQAVNNTVVITPCVALAAGEYTLTVSRGSIVDIDGMYNKEINTTFSLNNPLGTFNPYISDPTTTELEAFPSQIRLDFPSNIGKVTVAELDIIGKKNGKVGIVNVVKGKSVLNRIRLDYKGDMITAKDVYTIVLPAKTVFDANYGSEETEATYNKEFVVELKIAGADAPSDEIVAEAKKWLEYTGVGYPSANATERTTLAQMVENEDQNDEAFRAAIDAFIATDSIEFPSASKYYTIANVSVDGTKHYLAYSEGKVTLTADSAEAYSFLVETEETSPLMDETSQKIYFKTSDGKYLHTLAATTDYDGVTPDNVTSEKKDVNLLTLERLQTGDNAKTTFGFIAMSGKIDENTTAYSTVRPDGTIKEANTTLLFEEKFSSAFVFAEAEAPALPDPETTWTISPVDGSTLESLTTITLTIANVSEVTQNTEKKITLSYSNDTKEISNITIAGNVITMNVSATDDNTYVLDIPKGALTYEYEGRQIEVPAIKAIYVIKSNDLFNYDFSNKYSTYTTLDPLKVYAPEDLNSFYLYTYETEFFINTEKVTPVQLIDYYHTGNVVATGTLSSRYDSEKLGEEDVLYTDGVRVGVVKEYLNETNTKLLILKDGSTVKETYIITENDSIVTEDIIRKTSYLDVKFDKALTKENMSASRYGIIIAEGSYGDSFYGEYLSGNSVVKRSDCHLASKLGYYYDIDPSVTPVGIENVETENGKEDAIFDLSGRRVNSVSQPGIYIKNGKKVVIK